MKLAILSLMLAVLFGVSAMPALADRGSSNDDETEEVEDEQEDEDDDEDEDEDEDEDDTKEDQKAFDKLKRHSPAKVLFHENKAELNAGTVTDVDGSIATIAVFGNTFKVETGSARFKEGTALADGDRVWIKGKVNPETGVITASEVRTFSLEADDDDDDDDSATSTPNRSKLEGLQKQVEKLLEQLKKLLGN